MDDLYLIDANSIIHRCFHAMPPLTTPGGAPASALYGIANILAKLYALDKPRYAVALFDRPEPTFREAISAEYKANRPPTPDDLVAQIIAAHDIFPAFGITTFEAPGYEADDLIATLARRFVGRDGLRIVILTGDLDTLQLVRDDRLVVRFFRKGITETDLYNESAVVARYGLSPNQLADYKAFVGDNSDNVRGLPGIGPKTAVALLAKYGTIENIYAHLAEEPKAAARLESGRADLDRAKSLVELLGNAPMDDVALEDLAFAFDEARVREYCTAMGFRSLAARLGSPAASATKNKKAAEKSKSAQGAMF